MSTATAEPGYERLSFFDSTYLALEQANSYMHIAAIQVYEAGPLGTDAGGIDIEKIRQFVASKLHRIPRYRQRLAWIPIENFPVWVDDAHFNLDYHVKHTSLPRPGGNAELKRLAARLFARKLDRSRPLWELWVVEGLGDDRFAIVAKVHHCMIDGMAGVDLLQALLNVYPTDEMEEAVPWTPRPAPSETTLLIDEAVRLAKIPFELMRTAREVVLEGGHARADLLRKLEAARDAAKSGWFRRAGETPVNQALSPHRRFEWLSSDLDRVKYIKNQLGATVNDVVLATVAGAVRRFMTERGVDVDELEYRIMVPVSIRGDEHVGTLGNQVAMWLVELPVADTDAVDRLRIIRESIGELKGSDAALGATVLTQAGAFMPLNLLSRGVRLMWSASGRSI